MTNFCFALGEQNPEEREKIIIAGCFHDIGIWAGATFDYLPPSTLAAKEYLRQNGLAEWIPEIYLMIDQHHKLGTDQEACSSLVETFRRADLVDFSLGLVKCGLPKSYIKSVKKQFPNHGFHKRLVKLAGGWICRHPLNPIPVLKW